MPIPPAPEGPPESVKDLYWRLNQPMSGAMLEVYWRPDDDWIPAKFVTVPEDGRVRVKWINAGTTTDLPSHFVRNVGDGFGESEDPPLKRYLRTARPDWNEGDIIAVLAKLSAVGIAEARELYEAVLDDLNGYSDGINGLLRAHRQRILVPRTLNALKATGERMLGRRRVVEPELPPAAPVAAKAAARGREALDAQKPSSAEARAPAVEALLAEVRPGEVSSRFRHEDPVDAPPPQSGYMGSPPPAKHDSWQDSAPPKPVPAAPLAADSDGWAGDGFLASRVCCSNGHPLKKEPTPYDVNCDECGAELDEGAIMWRCDPCAYDLCTSCQVVKLRKAGGLPPAQKPLQPSPPRAEVQARAPVRSPPEGPRVHCPKGHGMKHEHPGHPVECNYCSKEMTEKVRAWSCAICGYHLCEGCAADRAEE